MGIAVGLKTVRDLLFSGRSRMAQGQEKGVTPRLGRLARRVAQWWRQQTVTLSVEKDLVRVVVFQGKEVSAWSYGTPDWEGQGNIPSDGAAGTWLHDLVKELDGHRGRLVMDLPLYSSLMRHLRLPRARQRYLGLLIMSEVLETIPFTRNEVDIAWSLQRDGRSQEVFAIAVPREKIDNQVRWVKEAGLSPRAAYPKALALASVVGIPDAIIIHLEQSQVDIILVQNSIPRVVHQLEFPVGRTSLSEQADALALAVQQVAGYYQAVSPDDQEGALPVVLLGQAPEMGTLARMLPQVLHRPVLPFSPRMDYPQHFPPAEYATNLGLYLVDRARTRNRGKALKGMGPSINLLSERHLPRPLPVQAIAVLVALLLVGVVAFTVTGRVDSVVQEKDALSQRLKSLEAQARQQRLALGVAKAENDQLQAVSQEVLGLESQLADLKSQMGLLLGRLKTITDVARPSSVRLTSLGPQGTDFVLAGSAASYEDVLQYAANLRDSALFADARVLRVQGAGEEGGTQAVTFNMKVYVPAPAAR